MSIASKRHDQPDHDGCTLFPATLTRLPDSASDDPIHPHETQKVYLGAPPVARIPETGFDSAPSRNAEILSSYFIVVFFTVTVMTVFGVLCRFNARELLENADYGSAGSYRIRPLVV
jgi:hypothetical protein